MASRKINKEPQIIYYIESIHNGITIFKGPYAGKRPVKAGEKLVPYMVTKILPNN